MHRWLFENIPEVEAAMKAGTASFGTIETWLVTSPLFTFFFPSPSIVTSFLICRHTASQEGLTAACM